MKTFFRAAALSWMCLQFSYTVAQIGTQKTKTHTCQSITEGVVAPKPYENMFIPLAVTVLLEADVPMGGQPVSLEIMERKITTNYPGGEPKGPWTTCQVRAYQAYCENVLVPAETQGNAINKPLGDWSDGSRHYGVLLTSRFNPQGNYYSSSLVRLVLTYSTDQENCISQQSWEMAQGSIQKPEVSGRTLMLPARATFVRYGTFGSSLKGAGEIWPPEWHSCDIWVQESNNFIQKDSCEPNRPGVLTFSVNWIDDIGYQVDPYQAKGIMFNCINSNEHRRACRAQIVYK